MKPKIPSRRRREETLTLKTGAHSVVSCKLNRKKKILSLVTSSPTKKRGSLRAEFHAWRASLPTALERDTLLTPEWIAESVVQEVERFLKADLPENFAERLAAKAHYLYPRHKHFQKGLNRPGNRGRDNLYMFMRHWTAGWLKREQSALYKKLPWSFGQGQPLPNAALSIFVQGDGKKR